MFCPKYKRENPNHVLCSSICCVCESLVRFKRWLPSHILRIIKKENSIQELDDHSVVAIKSLKIHKQECLYLLENPRKKEFVVLELSHGRVSKFSTGG